MSYDETIQEKLDKATFTCDVHGELEDDELDITYSGRIVCAFCSIDQEMDTEDKMDIDASIELDIPMY